MPVHQPDVSVVIGAQNANQTVADCLRAVTNQTKRLSAEIIVVDGSTDDTADIIATQFPGVTLIRGNAQLLIPHLWGLGISQASAPIVAIITAHCIPVNNWIANIISVASTQKRYAGFGGSIDGPSDGSLMDWAVYFSRYTAFMPPISDGPVAEIAGDNAVYRKQAFDDCWIDREYGFWETLFHHQLRTKDKKLYMSPNIQVQLGRTGNAWHFFRSRFRHGHHYGSTRPKTSLTMRVVRLLAAPVLMPFLLLRIGLRVSKHRRDWLPTYLMALPWLIFFLSAWSLGEISGDLWPQRSTA